MFWLGLIVGIIIGAVGMTAVSLVYCSKRYGSMEDFVDGVNAMGVAADNRSSQLQVWHGDELLDIAYFNES